MFWKRSCASSRGSTELSISDTTGAGSRLAISMKHSTSSLLSDHLSDILRIFTQSFSYKYTIHENLAVSFMIENPFYVSFLVSI